MLRHCASQEPQHHHCCCGWLQQERQAPPLLRDDLFGPNSTRPNKKVALHDTTFRAHVGSTVHNMSSVEYLDLEEEAQEQQQWRPLPSMKTARCYFAAFYSTENHKIVVAGGLCEGLKTLDMVEELPRSSRQLREPREPPRPRIQQWLDEMKRFLESIDEREGELIQERVETVDCATSTLQR